MKYVLKHIDAKTRKEIEGGGEKNLLNPSVRFSSIEKVE